MVFDKVICPWCGAEMYATGGYHDMWTGQMTCKGCGANGPRVRSLCGGETVLGEARAAALRRYTPPIKPMTFEEVERIVRSDNIDDETPLYLEDVYGHNCWEISYKMTYMCRALKDDYGKTWRCWERKPTEEERSAAEWET